MKIKAFTIWELIIVMVVVSIIIMLATGVYFKIQGFFAAAKHDYNSGIELCQMIELLEKDVEYADKILVINNDLLFEGLKYQVNYHFEDNWIARRENLQTDTFFIKIKDFEVSHLKEFSDYIKTIEFTTSVVDLAVPVCLIKEYENQKLYQMIRKYEY